jgi:hypothetical protein
MMRKCAPDTDPVLLHAGFHSLAIYE